MYSDAEIDEIAAKFVNNIYNMKRHNYTEKEISKEIDSHIALLENFKKQPLKERIFNAIDKIIERDAANALLELSMTDRGKRKRKFKKTSQRHKKRRSNKNKKSNIRKKHQM